MPNSSPLPSSAAGRAAVRKAGTQLLRSAIRAKLSRAERALRARRDAYHQDLWLAAAEKRGLVARRAGGSEVAVELGDRTLRISRTGSSIEDAVALEQAGDKALVSQRLAARGIPVPASVRATLTDLAAAEEFLARVGCCVVKPAQDTSAGRGVTTSVQDVETLHTAAVAAAAAGARAARGSRTGSRLGRLRAKFGEAAVVPLLVEQHVEGDNYRLLYLDGELIDAVRRAVPTVVGNGRDSLRTLIGHSAQQRATDPVEQGGAVITIDDDLRTTLRLAGLDLTSVPADGEVVELKTAVNEGAISDHVPATGLLCADIVEQGAVAAASVGGRLVGVDVITSDPTVPLNAAGGVVLEVNTTPGLSYHYHGKPGAVDVVGRVLDRLTGVPVRRQVDV